MSYDLEVQIVNLLNKQLKYTFKTLIISASRKSCCICPILTPQGLLT